MEHLPVLLKESIEGLNVRPDGIYIDATLGRGGHSREIAKKLRSGRLVAIDRDGEAIEEAGHTLSEFKEKITFVHGNFGDIADILSELGIKEADGMLFDLGVSSPQLDDENRGFSYMKDSALDMRADLRDTTTAFDVVNYWPEDRLRGIFYEFGEERYARQIARAIAKRRGISPISTTFELNDVVLRAIPPAARREKQHPSKRCYQALRIAVNDELGAIEKMLNAAPDRLSTGGRLCLISFQSLEDRLVKKAFNSREKGCKCSVELPVCICGFVPTLKTITKKPVTPGPAELEANPRSRSAKLRIAERV